MKLSLKVILFLNFVISLPFCLPNSKIDIRFPVFHLKHDYATSDDTGGVLPDITTTYSLQELIQQVDKEMDVVYELVGN